MRPDEERIYNSPWNIASKFNVDMSFNSYEISTMLREYDSDHNTSMDIDRISSEIYEYTRGYPFLVSDICKIIDEELGKNWIHEGIEQAVKIMLTDKNTLFDDLIKNLENNKGLYELVYSMLVELDVYQNNIYNPTIETGMIYGIISVQSVENQQLAVANKIFEILIFNYMISKKSTERRYQKFNVYQNQFIKNGKLNMELVINKFQDFMRNEYKDKDQKFIEREGRLLFLCFLKPIINGEGFYYVESETRYERRMDIVVTYGREEFIIELKIWHGDSYDKSAQDQLLDYMDSRNNKTGYLVSFCFNKDKEYKNNWNIKGTSQIYEVVV